MFRRMLTDAHTLRYLWSFLMGRPVLDGQERDRLGGADPHPSHPRAPSRVLMGRVPGKVPGDAVVGQLRPDRVPDNFLPPPALKTPPGGDNFPGEGKQPPPPLWGAPLSNRPVPTPPPLPQGRRPPTPMKGASGARWSGSWMRRQKASTRRASSAASFVA